MLLVVVVDAFVAVNICGFEVVVVDDDVDVFVDVDNVDVDVNNGVVEFWGFRELDEVVVVVVEFSGFKVNVVVVASVVVEFWGFKLIVVEAVSAVVEFWGFKVVILAVVVVVAVVVVEEMTDEVEIWGGEIVEVLVADVDWSENRLLSIFMKKNLSFRIMMRLTVGIKNTSEN